jgi:hypothetical protein
MAPRLSPGRKGARGAVCGAWGAGRPGDDRSRPVLLARSRRPALAFWRQLWYIVGVVERKEASRP